MTRADREKIEAYARVVGAAREVLRATEGVRLPYKGEGWVKLLLLRRSLAEFDRAHGVRLSPVGSDTATGGARDEGGE